MKTFCIKMIKENKEEVCEFLNEWQDEMVKYIEKIAEELNVSNDCASNIVYLRSRSRWTQELEDELIRMDREENIQPNMNDYGH